MNKAVLLTSAVMLAATLSACASGPHTVDTMATGSHVMPGPKAGTMSDRVMPSRSADCTDEALAKMPPEHRQACEAARAKPNNE